MIRLCGIIDVLSGVGLVVHEQQLDLLDVVDDESLVAGGHLRKGVSIDRCPMYEKIRATDHVTSLLGGTVANLGHSSPSSETPTDGAVNTLGLAPAGVDAHEAVALVAGEARGACRIPVNMVILS